jgi:type II secretory pathway predicted ATPase ExeA
VLLRGPGGIGKTLLLRLLARRVDPQLRTIYVPVPTLEQSELCVLVLGLVGETASEYPEPELLDFCGTSRARGRPVLVLVDDAGSMCPAVARGLAALSACSHGALRIVLAVTDDARSELILAALGPDAVEIPLRESMSPAETERYLRGRLARASGSDTLDRERVARLHAESGGNPADLHAAWLHGPLESA